MTQPDSSTRDSGGIGLTNKLGPLPVWGWIALAAAGGIAAIVWLRSRKPQDQQGNTTEVQGPDSATVQNLQDEMQVVISQIRDLQGGGSIPPSQAPIEGVTKLPKNVNLYDWVKQQQATDPTFPTFLQIEQLNPDLARHLLWQGDKSPYTPYVMDDVGVKVR
jgi:hypothetical protein